MNPVPGWGQRKPPSVVPEGTLALWPQWLLWSGCQGWGDFSHTAPPPQVGVFLGWGTQIMPGSWTLRTV